MKYDGWESTVRGVTLVFLQGQEPIKVHVDTADVCEVRDDLTEAVHDPRGYRAVDILVRDILPRDLIYVLGNYYTVTNLLSAEQFPDEHEYIVQFEDGSFSQIAKEVTLPGDQQVTVYRRPDDAAASM
jgi:hypothetical protein